MILVNPPDGCLEQIAVSENTAHCTFSISIEITEKHTLLQIIFLIKLHKRHQKPSCKTSKRGALVPRTFAQYAANRTTIARFSYKYKSCCFRSHPSVRPSQFKGLFRNANKRGLKNGLFLNSDFTELNW